jgi:3-oxoadipate enol-lactonase
MSPQIQANEISMAYSLDGPEDAPVVMFSTSLMCDHRMWEKQASALVPSYRVLRYDTRGHGGSEATSGEYTMDLLADDAASLLKALGIERVHFVGLSLGGFIGQALTLRHPDIVASLVLCDTACHMPPESMWDDRVGLMRSKGVEPFAEIMVDRWFTEKFRETSPHELEPVKAMIRATSADGFVGCCHAAKNMNFASALGGITKPTLVVVGEHDPGTPVSAARVLHEGIKGSELCIIDDAAHLTNIEKPDEFNAALTKFLWRH